MEKTPRSIILVTYIHTLVNVYGDLVVFSCIACTSKAGSGRYWC